MAVLPRQTLRLVPADEARLVGPVDLVWSYRDQHARERELRLRLDLENNTLRIIDPEDTSTIAIPNDAITHDPPSKTVSVDLPGWLSATLDDATGQCLYARSPMLAELGCTHGRSRTVRAETTTQD